MVSGASLPARPSIYADLAPIPAPAGRRGIHVSSPAPGLVGPPPAVQRPVSEVGGAAGPSEPQHICIIPGCSESCIGRGGQTQFCGLAHFEEGRQAGLQSYPYYRFSEETAHLQALGLMDFLGDLKDSGSPPDHDDVMAFSGFKQALHDLAQNPPQDADPIFASAQPTRPPIKKARSSGSGASAKLVEPIKQPFTGASACKGAHAPDRRTVAAPGANARIFFFFFNIFFFISFLLISMVDRSAWTRYRGVWGRRQPLIHLAEKNGRLDSSP
eukprot:COSAG06_NODE_510_length_14871_cov_12.799824_2_plen_271_part_00